MTTVQYNERIYTFTDGHRNLPAVRLSLYILSQGGLDQEAKDAGATYVDDCLRGEEDTTENVREFERVYTYYADKGLTARAYQEILERTSDDTELADVPA